MDSVNTIKKGDMVKLFGHKMKIYIHEDQNTNVKIIGSTNNGKIFRFTYDKISSIVREKEIIYQSMEDKNEY